MQGSPVKQGWKMARQKAKGKTAKKPVKKPLKVSHEAFVKAFIAHNFNATRAYMAVYKCTEATARRNASALLTNTDIQAAVRRALDDTLEDLEITPQRVLEEIARMAFSNMEDFIKINEDGSTYADLSAVKGRRKKLAAIQEITSETYMEKTGDEDNPVVPVKKVKLKLADKKSNLELLGKYLKIFSDAAPAPDKFTAEILEQVLNGELTVRDAVYKLQIKGLPLPEVLKIEFSKQAPEEGDASDSPSADELDKRYQEAIAAAEGQREGFLPVRQAEVAEIKESMKHLEAFKADHEPL